MTKTCKQRARRIKVSLGMLQVTKLRLTATDPDNVITARIRSMEEGNVFSLSVHMVGVLSLVPGLGGSPIPRSRGMGGTLVPGRGSNKWG